MRAIEDLREYVNRQADNESAFADLDELVGAVEEETAGLRETLDDVLAELTDAKVEAVALRAGLEDLRDERDELREGNKRLVEERDRLKVELDYECEVRAAAVANYHESEHLPYDADGKCVRIGNVYAEGTVESMHLSEDGWTVTVDYGRGSAIRNPKTLHHYHEPTVADVLREFDREARDKHTKVGFDGLVDEYASKLQIRRE